MKRIMLIVEEREYQRLTDDEIRLRRHSGVMTMAGEQLVGETRRLEVELTEEEFLALRPHVLGVLGFAP